MARRRTHDETMDEFERDRTVVRDHPSHTQDADALSRPHDEPAPES